MSTTQSRLTLLRRKFTNDYDRHHQYLLLPYSDSRALMDHEIENFKIVRLNENTREFDNLMYVRVLNFKEP